MDPIKLRECAVAFARSWHVIVVTNDLNLSDARDFTESDSSVVKAEMKQEHKKFGILGLAVVVLLTLTAIGTITPWAFHMGGRFTPLYWSGSGMLVAKQGAFPLYVLFYPADGSNRLHGWGSLCISKNTIIPLDLHGEVGKAWWSIDRASMDITLSEPDTLRENILAGYAGGGFRLIGNWQGPDLVLDDGGNIPTAFRRSGLKVEHASVILKPVSKSDFKAACSTISNSTRSSRVRVPSP